MRKIIFQCKTLTNIDLSLLILNIKNMSHIFSECENLTNIELSSFNTKDVEYMIVK